MVPPLQLSQWIPAYQLQDLKNALDRYDNLKDVSPTNQDYNEFRACRAKINSVLNLYVINNTELVKEFGLTEREVGLIGFGETIDVRDEVRAVFRIYLRMISDKPDDILLTALTPKASKEARANASRPVTNTEES